MSDEYEVDISVGPLGYLGEYERYIESLGTVFADVQMMKQRFARLGPDYQFKRLLEIKERQERSEDSLVDRYSKLVDTLDISEGHRKRMMVDFRGLTSEKQLRHLRTLRGQLRFLETKAFTSDIAPTTVTGVDDE